jgi:hypothetical protein
MKYVYLLVGNLLFAPSSSYVCLSLFARFMLATGAEFGFGDNVFFLVLSAFGGGLLSATTITAYLTRKYHIPLIINVLAVVLGSIWAFVFLVWLNF